MGKGDDYHSTTFPNLNDNQEFLYIMSDENETLYQNLQFLSLLCHVSIKSLQTLHYS